MGTRHEDMDAAQITVEASNSTTYTAFSGSSLARIHHVNVYNKSTTLNAEIYLKVSEGTSGKEIILRRVDLEPEKHTTWAGGLGSDDVFKILIENNDASSSITVDVAWW